MFFHCDISDNECRHTHRLSQNQIDKFQELNFLFVEKKEDLIADLFKERKRNCKDYRQYFIMSSRSSGNRLKGNENKTK